MKTTLIIIFSALFVTGFSQTNKQNAGTINRTGTTQGNSNSGTINNNTLPAGTQKVKPRQTATERRLSGPQRNSAGADSSTGGNTGNTSPFAGGMHAADNAAKTFDTATNNTNNQANGNATIAGGNDTTFNVNTVNQGGVTTNSGAVDRSGQAQFGQTNWGNSRSTVGESQWTIPPPITASFNKEFPAANTATWTRNNVDTSIYSARYQAGAAWVTANYNAAGQRLDMRTEVALLQPPRAVSIYLAKQPNNLQVAAVYKLQLQGKPDVYEIETASGKKFYINNDGMEVNY